MPDELQEDRNHAVPATFCFFLVGQKEKRLVPTPVNLLSQQKSPKKLGNRNFEQPQVHLFLNQINQIKKKGLIPMSQSDHFPLPELESISYYLDYLILERVAEFSDKILPNDPQLQENRAEMENFLNLLENLLPAPGGPAVLNAINETSSAMITRCQELIYRRGLEDGAELIRILIKRVGEQKQNG